LRELAGQSSASSQAANTGSVEKMNHRRRTTALLAGSLLVVMTTAGAAVAASAGATKTHPVTVKGRPLDGFFSSSSKDLKKYHSADVELTVKKHGKRVGWPGGATCKPNAAAVSKGILSYAVQLIDFPQGDSVAIAKNGHFKYSKTITLTPEETQSGVSFRVHVTITGKFVLHTKLVKRKTTAVKGHFSAPALCAASTPSTFTDYYAGKNV
jgi:hypothetical protein